MHSFRVFGLALAGLAIGGGARDLAAIDFSCASMVTVTVTIEPDCTSDAIQSITSVVQPSSSLAMTRFNASISHSASAGQSSATPEASQILSNFTIHLPTRPTQSIVVPATGAAAANFNPILNIGAFLALGAAMAVAV